MGEIIAGAVFGFHIRTSERFFYTVSLPNILYSGGCLAQNFNSLLGYSLFWNFLLSKRAGLTFYSEFGYPNTSKAKNPSKGQIRIRVAHRCRDWGFTRLFLAVEQKVSGGFSEVGAFFF